MSNAELIERSREMCARMVGTMDWHTAVALVDALETAAEKIALYENADRQWNEYHGLTERLEAAEAVIGKVRAWNDSPPGKRQTLASILARISA